MRTFLTLCLFVLLTAACRADAPVDESTALGWLPPGLDCVGSLRPSLLPVDIRSERSRVPALLCPLLLVKGLDQRAHMRAVAFGAKRSGTFTDQCCVVVGDSGLTYEALHTLGHFPPEKGRETRPVLTAAPRPGIVVMSTDATMLREMIAAVGKSRPRNIPDLVMPTACAWVIDGPHHLQMVPLGPETWQIHVDAGSCTEPQLQRLATTTPSGTLCFDGVSGEPAVVITGLLASKILGYPFDLPGAPSPH